MRVLIIEDEPDVADFLARALREAAWAPDVAATGDSALQSLSANDYDLAVLDLGLPDIDGFEVCRRWRAQGGRTPILMLTPRQVRSRGQILEHVWDDNFDPVANAVDVLVGRVRRKIAQPGEPPLLHTVRGMGYLLSDRPPPDAP